MTPTFLLKHLQPGLQAYDPAVHLAIGQTYLARRYTTVAAEYDALYHGVGLVDRGGQAWLALTGKDRQTWLNNTCTNEVKKLSAGDGADAFVLNIKGRMLFEISAYVARDEILISVDGRQLAETLSHFDKYIIMDDVQVTDRSAAVCRVGLMGGKAADLLSFFGMSHAHAMANSQHSTCPIAGYSVTVSKSHFAGAVGFDLVIPREGGAAVVNELVSMGKPFGLLPAGTDAVKIARIEAGRAAAYNEITEDYIPNETAQDWRCVNWTKGCYLGQEITIRIRHQGAPARYLRGLVIDRDAAMPESLPTEGSEICLAEKPDGPAVGRLTSVADSPIRGVLGLAYLKKGAYDKLPPLRVVDPTTGSVWTATAVELPFVPQPS